MMNIQYTMLPLNLAKTRYFLGLINLFKKNMPNINFWIGGVLYRRCPHTLHTCCPVHTLYIFTVFFSLGTLYISSYINQNIKKRLKKLVLCCWFSSFLMLVCSSLVSSWSLPFPLKESSRSSLGAVWQLSQVEKASRWFRLQPAAWEMVLQHEPWPTIQVTLIKHFYEVMSFLDLESCCLGMYEGD